MSVVSHIATQRTDHGVPHAMSCRLLSVSESWFYKWRNRQPTATERRREELDLKVRIVFETSGRTYGSPRVRARLRADGEQVSKKTVAASMARQGLVARHIRRRRSLTRPDKAAVPAPDLVRRDFTADRPDHKWCGDFKHIPTQQGPVYLATVEDLYSRRVLGFALSDTYPTAALAQAAINMAVATRGGNVRSDLSHRPRFPIHCRRLHRRLPKAGDRPVDGKSRLRVGQRPRRVVLLHPANRTPLRPQIRDQSPSPTRHRQLDPQLVQPPPTPLHPQHDQPHQLRKNPPNNLTTPTLHVIRNVRGKPRPPTPPPARRTIRHTSQPIQKRHNLRPA